MNEGTRQIIITVMKNDSTVTAGERSRLLTAMTEPDSVNTTPRLIRRKEAAARLGLSLRAVDRLAEEGSLSKRIFPGRKRSTGILESDLNRLIVTGVPHEI